MDLEPGWEKKALMVLAVITIIVVVYVYIPFEGEAKTEVLNNTSEAPAPAPVPTVTPPDKQTPANITNVTDHGNQITADQAEKNASQANFTTGEPAKGNLTINNNSTVVWIVPLMKGAVISKRIYVDAATGVIVGSEEVKINQTRKRPWGLLQ